MGGFFQHASDRSGVSYPGQLSHDILWACWWLAIVFCALHAIRRARSSPPAKPPVGYNLNQRLYHWGNLLLLLLVGFSGFVLYFRRIPQSPLEISWLQIHVWGGLLFAAGVVFHAVAASMRGDWRSMRPERRDLRDAATIWRNFLGRTRDY